MYRVTGARLALSCCFLLSHLFGTDAHLCQFDPYESHINCDSTGLTDFPDFRQATAASYSLNNNSFLYITPSVFPAARIYSISITHNRIPMQVDAKAFDHIATTLGKLHLGDVDFDFSEHFKPVRLIDNLRYLELSNSKWEKPRKLKTAFLDPFTVVHLSGLVVSNSGIADIGKDVLKTRWPFIHLTHLGFPHNKLKKIPIGITLILSDKSNPPKDFTLDLSHNEMEDLETDWCPESHCRVTELILSHNRFLCLRLGTLDRARLLKKLDLQGNSLLGYLSPDIFTKRCFQPGQVNVAVHYTGLTTAEFALKSCIGDVYFWQTAIVCTCEHKMVLECQPHRLYGECLWPNGTRLTSNDAMELWKHNNCLQTSELPQRETIQKCGGAEARQVLWETAGCLK